VKKFGGGGWEPFGGSHNLGRGLLRVAYKKCDQKGLCRLGSTATEINGKIPFVGRGKARRGMNERVRPETCILAKKGGPLYQRKPSRSRERKRKWRGFSGKPLQMFHPGACDDGKTQCENLREKA